MIMHYPSGDAVVELIPESAKLNINTASRRRAVSAWWPPVSGDPAIARDASAQAIIDWRSPGPSPLDSFYLSLWPGGRADFPAAACVL